MTNCCLTNVKAAGSGGGSGPATTTLTVLNKTGTSLAEGDKAYYHYVSSEQVASLNPRGTSYLQSAGLNAVGKNGDAIGYTSASTSYKIDSLAYSDSSLTNTNLSTVTIPSGTGSRYSDWGIRYSTTGGLFITTYSTSSSSSQQVIHIDKDNYWASNFSNGFAYALGYDIVATTDTTNLTTTLNYVRETDGVVLASATTNRWVSEGTAANKNQAIAIGVNQVIGVYTSSAAYIYTIDWTSQSITETPYTMNSSQSWSSFYPKFATADKNIICFGYSNQQLVNGNFQGILCQHNLVTHEMTEIAASSLPAEMAAVFDGQSHSYTFVTFNHYTGLLTIVDGSNNAYSVFRYDAATSSWVKVTLPLVFDTSRYLYGPMTVSDDLLTVGYHCSSTSGSQAYRYLYFMVAKLESLNQNVAVSPELVYQSPTDYHQGLATESIAAGSTGSLTIFDEENSNV